jgi:hypothetical protein
MMLSATMKKTNLRTKTIIALAAVSVSAVVLAFVMFRPLILPALIGVAGLVIVTMLSASNRPIVTRSAITGIFSIAVIAPVYLMLVGIPGVNLDSTVLFHCSRCCGHEHLADGTYMHHNPQMAHNEDPRLVFWHQGIIDDVLPRA